MNPINPTNKVNWGEIKQVIKTCLIDSNQGQVKYYNDRCIKNRLCQDFFDDIIIGKLLIFTNETHLENLHNYTWKIYGCNTRITSKFIATKTQVENNLNVKVNIDHEGRYACYIEE